jgi:hypothetical protein
MKPIVDGFSYSLSRLMTPMSYYQNVVAQMENLRRANGYHLRMYNVPDDLDEPIPAYGTLEYQVRTQPGAYLYALMFHVTEVEEEGGSPTDICIQITDACTESHLFSDFTLGSAFAETTAGIGLSRPPVLMPQPVLIGPPGLVNVELSNRASSSRKCQLVLFFAEPSLPALETAELLRRAGHQV